MLAEYFLTNEKLKDQWKNVLLQVGRKKRAENGLFGNQCVAINMMNEKRVNVFIDSLVIEDRDVKAIEKVLMQAGCKIAEKDCSIYIQISHTLQ